jgi:predicted nucleic acid-binding protein
MEEDKYKIVFDTNFIYYDLSSDLDKVFNSNLLDIRKFLDEHKLSDVYLAIPDLVVKERLFQRLEDIEGAINKIDDVLEKFKNFNIKLDLKSIKSKNYQEILEKKIDKILKVNKIKVIKTIDITQEILIKRVLGKVKPFREGDRGFKDTIIWLSIIEDIKRNKDENYIFCTNNTKDFIKESCQEEFGKYSKKEFTIIPDMAALKEYLDKKLVLNLELEELYRRIEEELKEKTGTIMAKVNSFLSSNRFNPNFNLSHTAGYIHYISFRSALVEPDEDRSYFDFKSFDVTNITNINNEKYNINLLLSVERIEIEKDKLRNVIYHMPSEMSFTRQEKINVNLIYDGATKNIEVNSAVEEGSGFARYLE